MAKKAYEIKGVPTKICAVSRVSLKVRDNFYTIEASEERTIQADAENLDMGKEWDALFQEVNDIADAQAADIIKTVGKK